MACAWRRSGEPRRAVERQALPLPFPAAHLPMSAMLQALLAQDPTVRDWLEPADADPTRPDAEWIARFLQRAPVAGWDRAAIAAITGATLPPAWREHGALVVTGQQPALGGGPFYTLVKIAAAIATAARVSIPAVPVAPLFWCASEDHDLGEAGHADLLRRDGTIVRVADDLGGGRASLRFRSARHGWDALLAAGARELGPGPGEAWLVAHAPGPDEGLGAWVGRLLAAFFAPWNLLTIEAHRLRPLARPALGAALTRWPAAELAGLRARVLAAGHGDAFGALDHAPLFADRPDGRVALDPAAALALLAVDPDALSAGAALRPALQQAALPAAIFVAGPGELAYHAFLGPVYAALGVPRPLLLPRPSLALAPGWFRRASTAWGVDPAVLRPDSRAPTRDTPLAGELAALDTALAALMRAALTPDLTLRRDAGATRLRRERDRLARSLARGERRAAGLTAFGALVTWLHPRGHPQERTMSLFQAIWEHGPGLATLLVDAAAGCGPGERRLVNG